MALAGNLKAFSFVESDDYIECKFKYTVLGAAGPRYTCFVENQLVEQLNERTKINQGISFAKGSHQYSRGNKDVEAIIIRGSVSRNITLDNIPEGLSEIFPNTVALSIDVLNFSELRPSDLNNFKKLEYFFLFDTKVKTIDANLFAGNRNLKYITMAQNEINFIFPGVFENLPKLNYINLARSKCEDLSLEVADNVEKLKALKESVNLGGCVENIEQYKIIKTLMTERWEIEVSYKSVSMIAKIAIENVELTQKVDSLEGKLKLSKLACDAEKSELQEKIDELTYDNDRLKGDVSYFKKTNEECKAKHKQFTKDLDDIERGLKGNLSNRTAADTLLEILKLKVETQNFTVSKALIFNSLVSKYSLRQLGQG